MENEKKMNMPRLALFAVVLAAAAIMVIPGASATLMTYLGALLGVTTTVNAAIVPSWTDYSVNGGTPVVASGGIIGPISVVSTDAVLANGTVLNNAQGAITGNEVVTFTGTGISSGGCGAGLGIVKVDGVNVTASCTQTGSDDATYTVSGVSFAPGVSTPISVEYATSAYWVGDLTTNIQVQ